MVFSWRAWAAVSAWAESSGPLVSGPETAAGPILYSKGNTHAGEKNPLEFKDAEIQSVIKTIGEVSGRHIVVADHVRGKISVQLNNVPWDQALELILSSLGLEESGSVMTVYSQAALQRIPTGPDPGPSRADQVPQAPRPAKKKCTSRQGAVSKVAGAFNKLKSEGGKIVVVGDDIYVEDEPEAIAAMARSFIHLDRAVEPQVFIEVRIIEPDAAFVEFLAADWTDKAVKPGRPMKEDLAGGGDGSSPAAKRQANHAYYRLRASGPPAVRSSPLNMGG